MRYFVFSVSSEMDERIPASSGHNYLQHLWDGWGRHLLEWVKEEAWVGNQLLQIWASKQLNATQELDKEFSSCLLNPASDNSISGGTAPIDSWEALRRFGKLRQFVVTTRNPALPMPPCMRTPFIYTVNTALGMHQSQQSLNHWNIQIDS